MTAPIAAAIAAAPDDIGKPDESLRMDFLIEADSSRAALIITLRGLSIGVRVSHGVVKYEYC